MLSIQQLKIVEELLIKEPELKKNLTDYIKGAAPAIIRNLESALVYDQNKPSDKTLARFEKAGFQIYNQAMSGSKWSKTNIIINNAILTVSPKPKTHRPSVSPAKQ